MTGAVTVLLLPAFMGVLLAPGAMASTLPEETDLSVSGVAVVGKLTVPNDISADNAIAIWSAPSRRRLFTLDSPARNSPVPGVIALDADSRAEVARHSPLPKPIANPGADTGGRGPHLMAVDDQGGRLFVPYAESIVGGNTESLRASPTGVTCIYAIGVVNGQCVGGFHVLDAQTLEVKASIPVGTIRLDGATLTVIVRALEYAPPRGPGDSGKLLVVLEEYTDPVATGYAVTPRNNLATVVYAAQFDIDRAARDWIVAVEPCRGSRETRGDAYARLSAHPAAIMRDASLEDPAVYVGCHASGQTGVVVRIPLDANGNASGAAVAPDVTRPTGGAVAERDPAAARDGIRPPQRAQAYPGPEKVTQLLADAGGQRMLLRVTDLAGEVWWVFDARRRSYIGTVGIGPYSNPAGDESVAGLDRRTGRLYVLGRQVGDYPGGLFVIDSRRTPLAQALVFPHVAMLAMGGLGVDSGDPATGRPTRLYAQSGARPFDYTIIEDRTPLSTDPGTEGDVEGRTLDLDEQEGVTAAAFDAAGRGYGARMLLVGGLEAAARVGPADPVGPYRGAAEAATDEKLRREGSRQTLGPSALGLGLDVPTLEIGNTVRGVAGGPDNCSNTNRELVLGAVGPREPNVVDTSGARASAEAVLADVTTRDDVDTPLSRCLPRDWETLMSPTFSDAAGEEPRLPWMVGSGQTSCLSSEGHREATFGDPVLGGFSAGTKCEDEEAVAWGRASSVVVQGLTVGQAMSSSRLYRDPARGIVSRVESVVRGLGIPGVLTIDTVRGVAESWANGRRQPVAAEDREAGYQANCDSERTAGTCFTRQIFGVRTSGYSCGPCADERALIEGLGRAVGSNGEVRFREPDAKLAQGAENGFIAAIQKSDTERFSDLALNADLLQTVVPTLEIVRYASGNRGHSIFGFPPRGRQVYQFAGVEVSTSYGISCLLVYDEATNRCAADKVEPGSIVVSLAEQEGGPLAGGAFEVRADVDGDGVLGLTDALLPNGACVTTGDGVGTCRFGGLEPGAYLVSQVAAPPGYGRAAEPFALELASGEQRTVAFTNVSSVSTVELKAVDQAGAPLAGATFAAYPDADGDGRVAADAKPVGRCTTDAEGHCRMRLPAGSYVLVQTSAPGGLEPIEPVPFTFASGGQVAAVTVTNYPPDAPQAPPASAVYTPPIDSARPTEIVHDGYLPPVGEVRGPETAPGQGVIGQVGGTVVRVIRAPGDALRLLARDPKQAVAWTGALALWCLAVAAVRRRDQAVGLSRH